MKTMMRIAMGTMTWMASLAILTAAEAADFKPIFDGKTLNGWHCRPGS